MELAARPGWHQLPANLRAGITKRLGADMTAAVAPSGGFMPGLAVRLSLSDGDRVFVKALPAAHPKAGLYRTEARTCRWLPTRAPAPHLRWWDEIAGWVVLVFDDAGDTEPDLRPGSDDVAAAVATIATLHHVLTPCPVPDAPQAGQALGSVVHGWGVLAREPPADLGGWATRHLHRLAGREREWLAVADGATLVHGDIRADNLVRGPRGEVQVVDWAYPCRGGPWIDVAALIPHLILAGHAPAEAEHAVCHVDVVADLDPAALTSFAVAAAGYWQRTCREPAPPSAPRLKDFQARAAAAARAWVTHRTGWR